MRNRSPPEHPQPPGGSHDETHADRRRRPAPDGQGSGMTLHLIRGSSLALALLTAALCSTASAQTAGGASAASRPQEGKTMTQPTPETWLPSLVVPTPQAGYELPSSCRASRSR